MTHRTDIGRLTLRLGLGAMVLLHGIHKLQDGVGGIVSMVSGTGLPGVLGYGVFVGEVIAPLMLIAGVYSRIGGILVAINMLFAIFLAHSSEILTLTSQGGWAIELQASYLLMGVAVALLGSGRFALRPD